MLRAFFIYLSKSQWARNLFTRWKFAWKFASRFIAGVTLEEAVLIVKELNQKGFFVTIDHLGEHTQTLEDAILAADDIIRLLDKISAEQLISNVSIKLSQIGLLLGKEFCKQNLERIVIKAKETDNFIRIDMEDSAVTDVTLEILDWARTLYGRIGAVIQSYLYRSQDDVKSLTANKISIRMVKGAYNEPKTVAFERKADVDENFDELVQAILIYASDQSFHPSPGGKHPPLLAIGTHDPKRIQFAAEMLASLGIPKNFLEIQMLYGIRNDLQWKYLQEGYPVRIYVPYGLHWFPYFMRRLAERPANVWFFVSNLYKQYTPRPKA